jgi:hypothetical protein
MITIFGGKNGVFLTYQCMIIFFQNLALFCVKNDNFFAKFFGENVFKNQNIGRAVKKAVPNPSLARLSVM